MVTGAPSNDARVESPGSQPPESPPRSEMNDGGEAPDPGSTWFLESIYIENFKSYRGLTHVGPLKPFCAIIGPNGSGKSNLMDAISFVMGERTTSLRVKRLQELIHGASVGKPVSTNASVTAVFKARGSAEEEMRFARVIRGSASEYIVNGQVASQVQYFDNLKSLGINARGKNFLVFQGAIENIAMKNEKERCALLEELCGSSALKDEYERTKAELADAERKIETSHMKKKTVTIQKREIRVELQEAKQYNELLEQQAQKEIELYLFRLFHAYDEIQITEGHLVRVGRALKKCEDTKRTKETELKEKKKERGEITRLLSSKETVLNATEKEKSKWLPKQIEVVQRRKHLEKRFTNAEKSLQQARENKVNQEQDLATLNKHLLEVKEREKAFLEEHAELQMSQGVNVTLRESQLNEYWDLKKKVLQQTEKEKQKSEQLRIKKKEANDVYNSVSREKAGLESKLELAVHEIREKRKLGKKSFETVEELKSQLKSKEKEEQKLRSELQTAEANVDRLRKEFEEISSDIEAAKVSRHEASQKKKKQEAITALMTHFKGVKGRITSLCNVRHPNHAIAITKIMNKNMESIVVDTEKTARECIQYLKEQMMDRETFLPLDLLEVQPLRGRIREQAQKEKMFLAYDLLEFNREIEKAILHCVNSTVVCPTSQMASRVASGDMFGEPINAVSFDGTYYATSGIISGGKADLARRAGRWKDSVITQKEQQKSQIYEALKVALKTSRNKVELDSLEQEVGGIKNRLKFADVDCKLQTSAGKELSNQAEVLEADLKGIQKRWKKAEAAALEASNQLKTVQKRINATEDEVFKHFCEEINIPNIRAYEETDVREQEEFNRQKENIQQKLQQILMKIEYETEQQRTLENNIQRWENTVSELKKELKKCKAENDSIQDQMTEISARLTSIQDEVNTIKQSIEDKGKDITGLSKNLVDADKELLTAQKTATHLRESLLQSRMKRHDLFKQCKLAGTSIPFNRGSLDDIHMGESSLSSSRADGGVLSGSERSSYAYDKEDELDLNYEGLSNEFKTLSGARAIQKSDESLQAELHELEVKIGQIQAPNRKANQRWENITNKAREQQAEFDDMRKNLKTVREAFETVKKERLDKFMKCFDKISHNIDGIYKALTQHAAAQAVLGLDNPEEPYLDGVSYHCVVPGKRFQPMNNLSGGEKTLAALALLFAIHSFEPAPFFVLDEIDAALDNTNIGKVTSYIENNAANVQVLVISLKTEFYEYADALLGVTPDVPDSDCLCSKLYTLDLAAYGDDDSDDGHH